MRWCALALLVACSDPTVVTDDPFAPRTEPQPADTACAPDCAEDVFEARHIFIEGQFGYDAATRTTVSADLDGYATVPPAFWIFLAEREWGNDINDIERYCYIMLPFDNATYWEEPGNVRLWGGVQYAPSVDEPVSNCHEPGWELERELWGNNVVRDFVRAYEGYYYMAVGDPTLRIVNEVIPQFPPEIQPQVIGGSLGVPGFLGTRVDEVYGFAWETDENGIVELDVTGYFEGLPRDQVQLGDHMTSAFYDLRSYVYWSLE